MRINKIMLSGVIAQEPTVRENKNGNPYIVLDICENVYNTQTETTSPIYHTIKFSGSMVPIVEHYTKGDTIIIEGKMTNYKQTDQATGFSYKVSMIQCFQVQRVYKKQYNEVQPVIEENHIPDHDYQHPMDYGFGM